MSCPDEHDELTFNGSDAKLIARGLLELEVRLKKEIVDGVSLSYKKVLAELDVIKQSFGRIFNVLERHDTLLQDVSQKFTQQNVRVDKVLKEQEQMRKRLEGVERGVERIMLVSPTQNSNTPSSGGRGNGGGLGYGRGGGVGASQRNDRHFSGRQGRLGHVTGNSGGLPLNLPPPPPNFQNSQQHQFSSTAQLWTRRGSGEFTSEEDSDDENEESVVTAETPSAPPSSTSHPPARSRGLTGGFGNFRRGKPPTLATTIVKSTTTVATTVLKSEEVNPKDDDSGNVSLPNETNFDSPLGVRPLTVDELQVFSKTGCKNTPPSFFGRPIQSFSPHSPQVYGSIVVPAYDSIGAQFGRGGYGRGPSAGGLLGKKHSRHRM